MSADPQSLQYRLWYALSPSAPRAEGLSVANRLVILAVLAATMVMVLETEPSLISNPALKTTFMWANFFFAVLFTIEFAARFYIAGIHAEYAGFKGRLRWLIQPVTLMDLAAFIPLYLTFFGVGAESVLLRVGRLIRIIGMGRVGHLTHAGRLLAHAIRARGYELLLIAFGSFGLMLFCATLLYVTEGHIQPDAFGSIPRALWWAVNALTTVGYGDVYPITTWGRIIGGISAYLAVGIIAAPAGILAAAFSEAFHEHRKHRENLTKKR